MAHGTLQALLRHIHRQAERADTSPLTDAQLLNHFLIRRDEEAFTALVRRHGRLVLAACRRSLVETADVEDAFQATFLVLLRKADSIRHYQALGCWLYRVACRTAAQARRAAERRQRHERQSAAPEPLPPVADPSWREVCVLLHTELDRLPVRLRLPLILCYLNGQTRDEAARQLGWSLSTLRGRLERGRRQLRVRLSRHGVELTAGVLTLLAGDALAAPLSQRLLRSVAGLAAGGPCPATVAALASAVATASTVKKVAAAGMVLAIGLLVAGAGVAFTPAGAPQNDRMPAPRAAAPAAPAAPVAADSLVVQGRVLGPDDKPVAGARLSVCDREGKQAVAKQTADAEGRFRFTLDPMPVRDYRVVLALADGYGVDWALLPPGEPSPDLTLRLPSDVPIRGKVVDLQGKSVAGASIHVVELSTSESGNLDEFLKRWAADKEKSPVGLTFRLLNQKSLWSPEALRQLAAATTSPDGTFRLTGIGRDRGLMLRVRGPGIADHYVRVVMRPDFQAGPAGEGQVALLGPEPTVVVSPNKPITGTVRDALTKQPLAGIRVLAYTPDQPSHWWSKPVETVTDVQGHYRLDGLAKVPQHIVLCDPGAGAAHMHRFDPVGDTGGFAPIAHDTELLRGIVVSGQVTDRATGRPVRARVVYAPLLNNEHFDRTPGYAVRQNKLSLWIASREMITGADGRYRLTALPGPGALFIRAVPGAGPYIHPAVPKDEQDPAVYHERGETFLTLGLGDIFPMSSLHAYRLIRPTADTAELTADFALDPGLVRTGRLIDPDGRPLAGAQAIGLATGSAFGPRVPLPGVEFTAQALNPAKPRRLFFWHDGRKLAGTVVLRGDEPEPVTVTLNPLAAVTGRAVLKNGAPLAGHAVEYSAWPELRLPDEDKRRDREPLLTDKEGRFRFTDLPAGVPLTISVIVPKTRFAIVHHPNIILEPGKTKDLGDLHGEPMPDEP